MALEIAFQPLISLPRVLLAQNDRPRQDYHWVGQKQQTPEQGTDSGNQNKNQPDQGNQRYRPLSSITLGEVEQAIHFFNAQLIPVSQENWIAKNHFCSIPLKRNRDGRPRVLFGRVKTCFPSDGQLDNIEDIELLFPHQDQAPDILHVAVGDISHASVHPTQSYHLRVRFLVTNEDLADFEGSEFLLTAHGFLPEFVSGYLSLLEITEQNHVAFPWLYVVSSRWLASIPDSMHMEVRGKLGKLIHWNKLVFNYHPDSLPREIVTLNNILGYKFGFTPLVLIEPKNPQETAYIISKTFDQTLEQRLTFG